MLLILFLLLCHSDSIWNGQPNEPRHFSATISAAISPVNPKPGNSCVFEDSDGTWITHNINVVMRLVQRSVCHQTHLNFLHKYFTSIIFFPGKWRLHQWRRVPTWRPLWKDWPSSTQTGRPQVNADNSLEHQVLWAKLHLSKSSQDLLLFFVLFSKLLPIPP